MARAIAFQWQVVQQGRQVTAHWSHRHHYSRRRCRAGAEHVQLAKLVDWRAGAWRPSLCRIPGRAVYAALRVRPCVDGSRARRQRRRRSPGGRRPRHGPRRCGRRHRRRRRAAENGRGTSGVNQSIRVSERMAAQRGDLTTAEHGSTRTASTASGAVVRWIARRACCCADLVFRALRFLSFPTGATVDILTKIPGTVGYQ